MGQGLLYGQIFSIILVLEVLERMHAPTGKEGFIGATKRADQGYKDLCAPCGRDVPLRSARGFGRYYGGFS